MKHLEMFFRPVAEITFTQKELDLMCECSNKHYDGKCQQASRVGGFLYGMNNPGFDDNDTRSHSLDFGKIDTLLKILEQGVYSSNAGLAGELYGKLFNVIQLMKSDTPSPIKF